MVNTYNSITYSEVIADEERKADVFTKIGRAWRDKEVWIRSDWDVNPKNYVGGPIVILEEMENDYPNRRRRGRKFQWLYNGKWYYLSDLAKLSGLKAQTIKMRLLNDWSVEDAVTLPLSSKSPLEMAEIKKNRTPRQQKVREYYEKWRDKKKALKNG